MLFASSPGAIDACGDRPGLVCEWVYDSTHKTRLAEIADWLVARPLRIALVIAVALLVNRLARRTINRLVDELVKQRASAAPPRPVTERSERSRQRAITLGAVLRSIAAVAIWAMALLVCLGELDINLGPLLAGAGVAGIAVGLGAQSLVRDFLAGIFVVIEDQFGVGDSVSLGPAVGVVEKVTLRTTCVRDHEGVSWVIPNGEIRVVANRSQRWVRAVVDLRVSYDTDSAQARELLERVADLVWDERDTIGGLLERPVVSGIDGFGESVYLMRLSARSEPGHEVDLARHLRVTAKAVFDAAGVKGLAAGAAVVPR